MAGWHSRAWTALHELAATGDPFTADDLIDRVGPPDQSHRANSRNSSIGGLFSQAASDGWIVSDGRVVRSRQPHRKGGAVRVWRGRRHVAPGPPTGGDPDATKEGGTS